MSGPDLSFVIDGTRIETHQTEGGKLVFEFPENETRVTVTGTNGTADTPQSVEKLAGGLLSVLLSTGHVANRASNPQNPTSRQIDPIQGYDSN